MEIIIQKNLIKLAKLVSKNNYSIYFVGGIVRNNIMNLEYSDVDICGNIDIELLCNLASLIGFMTKTINKKLGTALLVKENERYEYTQFRIDNYDLGGNHSPASSKFTDDLFIDAKRRDFTCNCIYYNVLTKSLIDPFNGLLDIKNKKLREIPGSDVFKSDGLRILRLIRFASELDFKIDKTTYKNAKEFSYNLKDISKERILKELKLILTADLKYEKYFFNQINLLNNLNIYQYIFNSKLSNFKLKLSKAEKENLKNLNINYRYIGFAIYLLANIFKNKIVNINQVKFQTESIFGVDGIKDGNESKNEIFTAYCFIQQILFNKKYDTRLMAMKFYNLPNTIKNFVNEFLTKKDILNLNNKINYLKENNIPLCEKELNISNEEIIKLVDKNKISYIKNKLFEMCFTEKIKNNKDDLTTFIKSQK